jgi:hypothetical protein
VALLSPSDHHVASADGVVGVLQIEDLPLRRPQDGAPRRDGLALVETAGRLHPEDLGSHSLYAGDTRGPSHEFDSVEGDGAVAGLYGSHGSGDIG